jgi:uncharacterized integral membrane protein
MHMLNRFMTVVVFIPLAIVLVALAVANRGPVRFTLDPFNPGNPGLTVTLPLFIYLFGALALGLIVGSVATWFRQGRYRKLARRREAELAAAPKPAAKPAPPRGRAAGTRAPDPRLSDLEGVHTC